MGRSFSRNEIYHSARAAAPVQINVQRKSGRAIGLTRALLAVHELHGHWKGGVEGFTRLLLDGRLELAQQAPCTLQRVFRHCHGRERWLSQSSKRRISEVRLLYKKPGAHHLDRLSCDSNCIALHLDSILIANSPFPVRCCRGKKAWQKGNRSCRLALGLCTDHLSTTSGPTLRGLRSLVAPSAQGRSELQLFVRDSSQTTSFLLPPSNRNHHLDSQVSIAQDFRVLQMI